jgi:hypothetical protein
VWRVNTYIPMSQAIKTVCLGSSQMDERCLPSLGHAWPACSSGPSSDYFMDGLNELPEVHWFLDVFPRPQLQGPFAVTPIIRAAEHDHGSALLSVVALQKLKPAKLGQIQIQQNKIRLEVQFREHPQALFAIVSNHHVRRDGTTPKSLADQQDICDVVLDE